MGSVRRDVGGRKTHRRGSQESVVPFSERRRPHGCRYPPSSVVAWTAARQTANRSCIVSRLRYAYGTRGPQPAAATTTTAASTLYLTFARMLSISSLRKARIVWVLTLPSEPILS